ncbi:MAG: type III pantothenate kinase [Planctomycetes bacterium]|nr:type III pantothenate kinase [Planctomycetota bacterium]
MDLLADLGNTRGHLALAGPDGPGERADVPNDDPGALAPALDALVARGGAPRRAALLAVCPRLRPALEAWLAGRGLAALALGETLRAPIPLLVDAPGQVGPDRVADAVWAARAHPGRAVLVADLGTALTLNVVSRAGAFVGGAIGPGLRTQAWALAERTARLPFVDPPIAPGDAVLGRDTTACIRAALRWGAVGLITAYAEQVERALGERPLVVATGGDAAALAPDCPRVDRVVADVTLRGLHHALLEQAGP